MPDDSEAPTPREGGGDTASGAGQAPPSEVEETEEETLRRIEWIKYYVRIGAPEQAYELGWDGLPFRWTERAGAASGLGGGRGETNEGRAGGAAG